MIYLTELFRYNSRSIASSNNVPITTLPAKRKQVMSTDDTLKVNQNASKRLVSVPGKESDDLGFKPVRSYINPTFIP